MKKFLNYLIKYRKKTLVEFREIEFKDKDKLREWRNIPAILIITSENQVMNLEFLEKYGAATCVSNKMNISTNLISEIIIKSIMNKELRNNMSNKGKLLVDGNGSERVVKTFQILNKKAKENNERENTSVNI